MPTWEMVAGANAGVVITANVFALWLAGMLNGTTTEARTQAKVYASYNWTNLYVRCSSFTGPGNATVISRIGAANGALTVTVTGTGTFTDTTNSDSPVDQNLVNYQISNLGGGNKTVTITGSTLQDTTTNITLNMSINSAGTVAFGINRYAPIGGRLHGPATADMAATETDVQYTLRRTTTYSNARVFVSINGLDGATLWRFRVDLGNGAQSISIGAGLTGAFEDTTNSDVVAAGSEIDYNIDTTASTVSNIAVTLAQVKHTSTGREMAAAAPRPNAFVADGYFVAESDMSAQATESNTQIAARAAFTARNLMVNVTAHAAGAASDIFLRVDTANSALTVNVPASTTGIIEDTTNQVSIAVGDLYNYFLDSGGESLTPSIFGMEQAPVDALVDLPQGKLNVLLRM